ncbi:hypothetical protein PR048_015049 [Dryococelus australis]|uniref:Uncharacterized protein n=1 Tax=Dryococelus australis TaxID=614101 RepID=A0ABQ9HG27_9NEOP|nr:hypothetical protein PR048_015049 [Dryococelus australis]
MRPAVGDGGAGVVGAGSDVGMARGPRARNVAGGGGWASSTRRRGAGDGTHSEVSGVTRKMATATQLLGVDDQLQPYKTFRETTCSLPSRHLQSIHEFWAALNNEVLRADEGEASWKWSSVRIQGRRKGRSQRKSADEWYCPARFPHAENPKVYAARRRNTARQFSALRVRVMGRDLQNSRKRNWGRNGKESALAFVRDPYQHSPPGVISGNHEKPKSGWPDLESNPGPLESESSELVTTASRHSNSAEQDGGPPPVTKHGYKKAFSKGRVSVEVSLLASHPGEPGLIPCGVAPGFSHVGIMPLIGGFSRGSPISPALAFRGEKVTGSPTPLRGDNRYAEVLTRRADVIAGRITALSVRLLTLLAAETATASLRLEPAVLRALLPVLTIATFVFWQLTVSMEFPLEPAVRDLRRTGVCSHAARTYTTQEKTPRDNLAAVEIWVPIISYRIYVKINVEFPQNDAGCPQPCVPACTSCMTRSELIKGRCCARESAPPVGRMGCHCQALPQWPVSLGIIVAYVQALAACRATAVRPSCHATCASHVIPRYILEKLAASVPHINCNDVNALRFKYNSSPEISNQVQPLAQPAAFHTTRVGYVNGMLKRMFTFTLTQDGRVYQALNCGDTRTTQPQKKLPTAICARFRTWSDAQSTEGVADLAHSAAKPRDTLGQGHLINPRRINGDRESNVTTLTARGRRLSRRPTGSTGKRFYVAMVPLPCLVTTAWARALTGKPNVNPPAQLQSKIRTPGLRQLIAATTGRGSLQRPSPLVSDWGHECLNDALT